MNSLNDVANRRRHKRFPLALPVDFEWSSEEKARVPGIGISRDISTNGMSLTTESDVPLNAWVSLHLTLPSRSGKIRRMKMHGQVVRKSDWGFAVHSKKQLVRERPSATIKFSRNEGH